MFFCQVTSAQNMAVEVLRSGSLIEGVLMCHVKSQYNWGPPFLPGKAECPQPRKGLSQISPYSAH